MELYKINLFICFFSSFAKLFKRVALIATSSIELLDCSTVAAVSSIPAADSSQTEAISEMDVLIIPLFFAIFSKVSEIT